jgi:serine/threonine protein kinase
VEYIHIKENLIHRDLKPSNIFFANNGQIKIGDLGLATTSLSKKCQLEIASPNLSFNRINSESSEDNYGLDDSYTLEVEEMTLSTAESLKNNNICFNNDFNINNNNLNINNRETHTSNIGTLQYAAPEQLNNNIYDNKVDIFSLGLILLELLYAYKTRMEKNHIHENLKNKRILPELFTNNKNYYEIKELILSMTTFDPNKRPGIVSLIQKLKNIISTIEEQYSFPRTSSFNLDSDTLGSTIFNKLKNNYNSNSNITTEYNSNKSQLMKVQEKRKRFLSEDICKIKSYELMMKIKNNLNKNSKIEEEWKKM